jgi:hypothetical protein
MVIPCSRTTTKSEAIDAAGLRDGALERVYNPVFEF